MNGYQRAALSLDELGESEQEWLLKRLSPEDRAKIIAARDALEANARRESNAIALQQSAADTIKCWDADTIQQLLRDEPLWVTVLVMAELEPALAESVIEQMEPRRAQPVSLALPQAPGGVKRRVVEVLLRALLEKSQRRSHIGSADFAATLTRFTGATPGVSKVT